MPVTVTEIAEDTTLDESNGIVESITRTVLIQNLTGGDITNLKDAREALDTAGLTYYSTTAVDSGLRLTQRRIDLMTPGAPDKATAMIKYTRVGATLGAVGSWNVRISSNLNSRTVSRDYFGIPISLSYTYPNTDNNYPGETHTQGAEVEQMLPQIELTYEGIISASSIIAKIWKYIGRINSTRWNQGNSRAWLCTSFEAEPWDQAATPVTWRVTITFQGNDLKWDKEAVFVDPETGKPPADVVNGVGRKLIQTQPLTDFNELIEAFG